MNFILPKLFEKQDYAIHHELARAHFSNGLFLSNSKVITFFPSHQALLTQNNFTDEVVTNKVVFTVQTATDKRLHTSY